MGEDASGLTGPGIRLKLFAAGLATAACSLAAALVAAGWHLDDIWVVAALAVISAIAEHGKVRMGPTLELSLWPLPALFAAVLFGPLAGGIVGAASMLGDRELLRPDPARAPRLKALTYASSSFIVGSAMGGAAQLADELVPSRIGTIIVGTFAGAVVGESLDVLFAGLIAKMRGRSFEAVARTLVPVVLTATPTYGPLVAALALAYAEVSPWTGPLFFVPAIAAHRLYQLYHQQRQLADDLAAVNETLARANLSFATGLIATLDARDRYTAGHSVAVAIYCRDIARRMDLSEELQEKAYLCGLVHDIGKIGLPAGLLEKPGALTLEERRQMQEHSAIGEHILMRVDTYADIAKIVRFHHERIDGEGYPDGLRGDEIPLLSRIIAVADAYNAMTSDRPYRDAMPSRVARHRLAQAVESQFDTAVVAAFEAILAGASEDYRIAHREDFRTLTTPYEAPESSPRIAVGAA
jgi:HD-GYP domain-containing protein (c-di-GMP phosphodiesterase class II)